MFKLDKTNTLLVFIFPLKSRCLHVCGFLPKGVLNANHKIILATDTFSFCTAMSMLHQHFKESCLSCHSWQLLHCSTNWTESVYEQERKLFSQISTANSSSIFSMFNFYALLPSQIFEVAIYISTYSVFKDFLVIMFDQNLNLNW